MKRTVFIGLIAVAAGVGGWLLLRPSAAPTDAATPAPVARVEVAALQRETLAQTVTAFGLVVAAPSGEHVIPATYDCEVRHLLVTPGARVARGDLLMEIAPSPDAALALASARSALTLARAAFASTKQRFDLQLATSPDLLAAQQAEQEAAQRMHSFELRGLIGDGRIVAPSAGVVSRLDLTVGAVVPAGTALLTLTTGQHDEVRAGLEPAEVALVAAGQTALLVSAHRPETASVRTHVIATGGTVDPVTGAALVRVAVPPGTPFLLGEHVTVTIDVKREEALVVPRSAVLPDGEKQVLFTVRAGKAVRHEVTVGISTDELTAVSGAGLLPGDQVVTLGNYELEDGMAVQEAAAPSAVKEPAR